jgi:hypothetical protein
MPLIGPWDNVRVLSREGVPASAMSLVGVVTPPLLNHIQGIVHLRAQEEVVWIHAPRNIAAVANQQTVWDVTLVNHPRDSVRLSDFSERPKLTIPR